MTYSLASFMKRFFSHYLPVQKGLSANTIAAYRDAIKMLLCYSGNTARKPLDNLAVEELTEKVVLGFLDYIQDKRSYWLVFQAQVVRSPLVSSIYSRFEKIIASRSHLQTRRPFRDHFDSNQGWRCKTPKQERNKTPARGSKILQR